ncbi:MAG: PD-(D/E)XK nuclease family protein [Dissulfurispiraceae bacterium]
MSIRLNIFDQYKETENRLTYALAVTLDRSKGFMNNFLKEVAETNRLHGRPSVSAQFGGGQTDNDGRRYGIPDLALIDEEEKNAIIIEAKLGASLDCQQLKSHENQAHRKGLRVVAAIVITGRDLDQASLNEWISHEKLKQTWKHVTWQQIYRFACQLAPTDQWADELRDFMEIMAEKLDEEEMEADVKIIDFAGISEDTRTNYSQKTAKRELRSLMDELRADKQFLKDIGIPDDQPPRKRKAIKGVWDIISPMGNDDNFTKSHHFTVGINPNRIDAFLSIPNASFAKFKKFVGKTCPEEFAALIDGVTKNLKKSGVIKAGGRPTIVLIQRRYRNRKLHAMDGKMEFDLRTWTGGNQRKDEPGIKKQVEWMEFSHKLIVGHSSNIQFQVGAVFPFKTCDALRSKKALDLIKATFQAVMPLLRETGLSA